MMFYNTRNFILRMYVYYYKIILWAVNVSFMSKSADEFLLSLL